MKLPKPLTLAVWLAQMEDQKVREVLEMRRELRRRSGQPAATPKPRKPRAPKPEAIPAEQQ